MQWLILGYDGKDEAAIERRMAVRDAHIELGHKLIDEGKKIYGGAIVDDNGKMIGSLMVGEFASREEVDQYLTIEPYANNNVWQEISISQLLVGPRFMNPAKPRASMEAGNPA